MKKIGYLFIFTMTMGLASCGDDYTMEDLGAIDGFETSKPAFTIDFDPYYPGTLRVGYTGHFTAFWNFDAKEDKITWTISNDGVEIVRKSGQKDYYIDTKMMKAGTTTVTARIDGYEAQYTVTIYN